MNSAKTYNWDIKKVTTGAWFPYISKIQSNFRQFARILFSRNFAYVKFCENKIFAKISEFTVLHGFHAFARYSDLPHHFISLCCK